MLRHLLILLSLFIGFTTWAQNPIEILKGAYQKGQTVRNGYFDMTYHHEFISGNIQDYDIRGFFKKLEDDTLSSALFNYQRFVDGEFNIAAIYTGSEFVFYNTNDTSGLIIDNSKWPLVVRNWAETYNYLEKTPFRDSLQDVLSIGSSYNNLNIKYDFVGIEVINGDSCFHVTSDQVMDTDDPVYDKPRFLKHFWIKIEDSVPIQYTTTFTAIDVKDTLYQFTSILLNDYHLNDLRDGSVFSVDSIPSGLTLQSYVPPEDPEPLPADTLAPLWHLPMIGGDSLSLLDLRGQLVLIDFFYTACYPCRLAMPVLQGFHETYGDKGLKVVGIDPIDSEEGEVGTFLAKRNLSYTVVLSPRELAKQYRVSGYPSTVLVDKDGKVIQTFRGYSEDLEQELEEAIIRHLE